MSQTNFSTDWLGSNPVFYNDKLSIISHNVNDVIDYLNIEFHPEGLNNYLNFGYSVLGQTPVKNIKFLPHSSDISLDSDGCIKITNNPDPVEKWIGYISHEDDVLHSIFLAIREWEKSCLGEIIIPTSGGFDSRLLNLCIKDKSRIRSFSYGISYNQSQSYEVVFAKLLSVKLHTKWQQIELGDYHKFFDQWYDLYGISTHAHGMYHIEFFNKILKLVDKNNPLLSGIIGDIWAGSLEVPPLRNKKDLINLGYTHGMHADPNQINLKFDNQLLDNFWETNKKHLEEPLFRVVWAMRFKLILLSYLVKLPKSLGFAPYSPFLDEKIAMGMATIPPHRRKNRIWQKDFFKMNTLNFEELSIKTDKTNSLNYQALRKIQPCSLNSEDLREIINPYYVRIINAKINEFISSNSKPVTLNKNDNETFKYYCAYLTLKPLEKLIQSRL